MKKGLDVLLVLSLIIGMFLVESVSADVNYALSGTPSFQQIAINAFGCSSTWWNTASNINDNDINNYVGGWSCAFSGSRDVWVQYNSIVTFAETDINSVEYVHSGARSPSIMMEYPGFLNYIRTYLYYNGAWNLINNRNSVMGKTTVPISVGGPWNSVTGVKLEILVSGRGETPSNWAESKLYEIKAWGPDLCSAETNPEFCTRLGKNCGSVTGADNCGTPRTVDCGTCTLPETCSPSNVCTCTAETNPEFCTRLGKNCGSVTGADNCGTPRTVDCGTCTSPQTCNPSNVCTACTAETNPEFCTRLGKNCGSVADIDNCGAPRTVDCGTCTLPETCSPSNVCCTTSCSAFAECGDDDCGGFCGPLPLGECPLNKPVCNNQICEVTGNAYWANLNGEKIGDGTSRIHSEIGDTVLLIYKDMGAYLNTYDFVISEEDWPSPDDLVRPIPASETFNYNGHLAAKWIINQSEFDKGNNILDLFENELEFYFTVNANQSNNLNINNTSTTPPDSPTVIIKEPVINSKVKVGNVIEFNQAAKDDDDDLKIKWIFEDGDESDWMLNCLTIGNCNTTHVYDGSGTKIVEIIAREMTRTNEAINYSQVFAYDEGINVFPIITDPVFGKIFTFSIADIQLISFNASTSYVANCTLDACTSGQTCPDIVDDLYCYDLDKTDISVEYDLFFDWTFSEGTGRSGNWDTDYENVVEFKRLFIAPTSHWAKLGIDYLSI
jgi:hypothetical protein